MKRSKVEHALSKAVVNVTPAPSELALDAIVSGVPVEETRPPMLSGVDVVWPSRPTYL